MKQYIVTGMSCAACSSRVEKAVLKVPGVSACSVSLLTNSMGVEGEAQPSEIVEAVKAAGYGARLKQGKRRDGAALTGSERESIGADESGEALLQDQETPKLKRRLWYSLGFLLLLMYLSMGHMMWGFYLPGALLQNPAAQGLLQLLLTGIIMVINQKFFISGIRSLLHGAPNMDTLVALGAGAAFGYSTYALFALTDAQARGDLSGAMGYLHEFYFESAAMILTLITVGKMLEARSKGRTTDALKGLMRLAPETAVILSEGTEQQVPIAQVKKGDLFVVRPGERIPVDGIVIEGSSAVNEAALTGESIPVDKEAGAHVSAATVNQSGFLKCEAVRVGEDTTLAQIIQMVSDAAATKAPIAKAADQVSGIFVPAVIGIALVTIAAWLLAGEGFGFALARGISVLVISCPCALGLATPVAIMVGNGVGAKNGILFKTAASLEAMGKAKIVVLDKTGTITSGEPKVTDLITAEGTSEEKLLELAYALERKSEHPLAKAVTALAQMRGCIQREVTDFQALPGNGLSAVLDGQRLFGGNERFVKKVTEVSDEMQKSVDALAQQGKTALYFARENQLLGVIGVADVIRSDSAAAVHKLRQMGLSVVMLTGDQERTAQAIGAQAGVDQVIAGVLPDGKESVIRKLQEQGRTIMVGDGMNDAPALTRADVGIAIGAGTDIAMDAADVVLMKSRLSDVPAAIRLSRATLKNIHENLFWAFFYNVIGIPLAAGVWIPLFGWKLSPMFGAAAMSLSSFCVVTNALRLNLLRLYDAGRGRQLRRRRAPDMLDTEDTVSEGQETVQLKSETEAAQAGLQPDGKAKAAQPLMKEKEEQCMKKTMKIQGMMCAHCEATVKKTLEAIEGVEMAQVSHQTGSAAVTLQQEISDETLVQAVEAQGYQVLEILG